VHQLQDKLDEATLRGMHLQERSVHFLEGHLQRWFDNDPSFEDQQVVLDKVARDLLAVYSYRCTSSLARIKEIFSSPSRVIDHCHSNLLLGKGEFTYDPARKLYRFGYKILNYRIEADLELGLHEVSPEEFYLILNIRDRNLVKNDVYYFKALGESATRGIFISIFPTFSFPLPDFLLRKLIEKLCQNFFASL